MTHITKRRLFIALAVVSALALSAGAILTHRPQPVANPVLANGTDPIVVMDFSKPFTLNPPPPGWSEHWFWFTSPMRLRIAPHQGHAALRCETHNGGSILSRQTRISLEEYPILDWSWFIQQPINSPIDERTKQGDDHPARFLLRFSDSQGGDHTAEIIWSNRLFKPGDYKIIGDFHHLVADGLPENAQKWRPERVDLLQMYRDVTGHRDSPTLTSIAIFCDSDNTGADSIAYFSTVRLLRPQG